MILAKARVVGKANGRVRVRLSFPTGFEPDEVVATTVRGNGVAPDGTTVDPRRGSLDDIYREFEATFPTDCVSADREGRSILEITGSLRRGISFKATLTVPLDHS